MRAQLVAQLEELIGGSDALPAIKRGELRGKISARPGLNRYLRVTPAGLLRADKATIKTETNLDGKYLLRCSDPHLPPKILLWATSSSSKSNEAGGRCGWRSRRCCRAGGAARPARRPGQPRCAR